MLLLLLFQVKPISALHIDTHPDWKYLLRRCCNCVLDTVSPLWTCVTCPHHILCRDPRICLNRDARINYGESREILLISSLLLLLLLHLLSQYWVMPQRTTHSAAAWNVMWLIRKKKQAGKGFVSSSAVERHRFDYRINKQLTRNGMANNWQVMDAFYCITPWWW